MNKEIEQIRKLLTKWPESLDSARSIDGIECVSWHKYTLEPITIRLTNGHYELTKGKYDEQSKNIHSNI